MRHAYPINWQWIKFSVLFAFYELPILYNTGRYVFDTTQQFALTRSIKSDRMSEDASRFARTQPLSLSLSLPLFLSLLRGQESRNRHSRSQFSRFKLVCPPQSRKSIPRLGEISRDFCRGTIWFKIRLYKSSYCAKRIISILDLLFVL